MRKRNDGQWGGREAALNYIQNFLDFDVTSSDSIPYEEVIWMEYTIQQLSRLSGVTTRALRWYDKLGLLKPSGRTEGGYRRYGPAEVDRLQDILYYRALGVELARVKAILDDPSYDRLAVLRDHLSALEEERERIQRLIDSVRETIRTQERNEIMNDEKKFEAFKRQFVEENERLYGAEAREKYGDAEGDGDYPGAVSGVRAPGGGNFGKAVRRGGGGSRPGRGGGERAHRPPPPLAHHHGGQVRRTAPAGDRGAVRSGPAVHRLL